MKASVGIAALLAAFPPCLGQNDSSKDHQPTHPLTSGSVCRVRDSLDFLSPTERAKVTLAKRVHAAKDEFKVGPTCHISNGDEESVPDFAGMFHKSLPHDQFGVVVPGAYEKLLDCAFSADINVCDQVPSGAPSNGRKMINPLGGTAHQIDGADSDNVFITTPDGVLSERLAAQMAEVYWMALAREIPFNDFASDKLIAAAAENLAALPEFKGLNIPRGKDGKIDPMQELFRTDWPGVTNGPVVSQLLLSDFVIDTINVPPKQTTLLPGMDYMTSVQHWLDVQNGASQVETVFVKNEDARFIRNGRDLAAIAFGDLLYTEAFRAALIMFRQGILSSAEGPYSTSERQVGFATFGEPHILTAMAASSSSTRHAWYAKWQVHRLLRPEAYGGLVHNTLTRGRPNTPLPKSLLENTELLDRVKAHNTMVNGGESTYLLPMAVAEGSPVHPAYPSGHAINVGAYITTLKAFLGFELGQRCYLEKLVMSNSEGTERIPYVPVEGDVCIDENGNEARGLTYEGELNKVAANVLIGRSHIGVHYRMDGVYGALMGETSAVRRLQEELPNLSEAREFEGNNKIPPASYQFRLYSGKVLKLHGGDSYELDGQLCTGSYTGDDFCEAFEDGPRDHLTIKGGKPATHTDLGVCSAGGGGEHCEEEVHSDGEVKFCNSIGCPNSFIPVPDANKIKCKNNKCTPEQCCDTFCAFHPCPNGLVPVQGANEIKCTDQKCTTEQCCDAFCSSHPCPNGLVPVRDANKIKCYDQRCTTEQCCDAFCSSHPCPNGLIPVQGAHEIKCTHQKCTAEQCCTEVKQY